MRAPTAVDWTSIDTVLLDLDGTLLDLRFDNWFWQEHIPIHYARRSGLDPAAAVALLTPKFHAVRGTMPWYCIDHWSRELGLDVPALKRAVRHEVAFLPGAEQFLIKLARTGKRRILVTNSHPETLAIKSEHVPLAAHFDATHSSHSFEVPKEHPEFWARFSAREPSTRRELCSSTTAFRYSMPRAASVSPTYAPCAAPTRAGRPMRSSITWR